MTFGVTIKLNTTTGVNLQEPSQSLTLAANLQEPFQSLPLITSWCSKKTFTFQSISDFGIFDKGYRTVLRNEFVKISVNEIIIARRMFYHSYALYGNIVVL
jgi:hypothetical protein